MDVADAPLNAAERAALRSFRRAALTLARLPRPPGAPRCRSPQRDPARRRCPTPTSGRCSATTSTVARRRPGGRRRRAAHLERTDRALLRGGHLAVGAAGPGAHARRRPAAARRGRGQPHAGAELPADGDLHPDAPRDGRDPVGASGDGARDARPGPDRASTAWSSRPSRCS